MQLKVYWGLCPQTPGVYPPEDTGEVEKQRISSAALHRISCSCVGSLSSVAPFSCIFSFGTFFGIIRVYTVVFSDPSVERSHKPLIVQRRLKPSGKRLLGPFQFWIAMYLDIHCIIFCPHLVTPFRRNVYVDALVTCRECIALQVIRLSEHYLF